MKRDLSIDDYLLLSGVQHYAFCPRQWALIHVEQQWKENLSTFLGQELHQNANDPFAVEKRQDVVIVRAVPLVSHSLQLYGVGDVVEFHKTEYNGITLKGYSGSWIPVPIEYKLGKPKATNCDVVQLCAQAICLEEKFELRITRGQVFYGRTRRRLEVEFTPELREETRKVAESMHGTFERGFTPRPEVSDACSSCSLSELCMPELASRKSSRDYISKSLDG